MRALKSVIVLSLFTLVMVAIDSVPSKADAQSGIQLIDLDKLTSAKVKRFFHVMSIVGYQDDAMGTGSYIISSAFCTFSKNRKNANRNDKCAIESGMGKSKLEGPAAFQFVAAIIGVKHIPIKCNMEVCQFVKPQSASCEYTTGTGGIAPTSCEISETF